MGQMQEGVNMGRIQDKVAVITGGASGIGAATTRLFVKEGAKVVIADIQDELGKKMVQELGASAVFIHTDVLKEADIKAAIDLAVSHFGKLDCMYNNAGYGGVSGPMESTDTLQMDATIGVLLRAVALGMKHAAPILKKQGYGTIISTASVAGMMTSAAPHIYSACKAAVIQLTRCASSELALSGVRVNCICPGFIETAIFAGALGLDPGKADEAINLIKTVISHNVPLGRMGKPEDIAEAALWLASDASSYVTGHHLVVDGGWTNGPKYVDFSEVFGKALGLEK